MPQTRDHVVLRQEMFRGLYSRGEMDGVPDSYFEDCLNMKFAEAEVRTRDGSTLNTTKANIVRFALYRRINETPRFIILDTSGNLWDSLYTDTPIWTDATFVDFSLVNYNNRAYITPHNRVTGIAGKYVLVYEGGGIARLAGGDAPTGFTLALTEGAGSGYIEAGIHLVAIAYLTSSGFITSIDPTCIQQITATGGHTLEIAGIPVGDAGLVAGRVLLATKSIPIDLFNGNVLGYEFFLIPNGIINDNSTLTFSASFFDSDLQNSADYLLDVLAHIPAGVGIGMFSGRLLVWGENAYPYIVRASGQLNPETVNAITGFTSIDPSAIGGVKNAAEFRKNLYLTSPNRLYVTSDNGSDPNTWTVTEVDKSCGAECFGINKVLDSQGTNNDRLWIADRSGLICFEGYVKRPELSHDVEDIWARINKAYFNLVQVVDDPVNHNIYISVPLDDATTISHILLANYCEAFTVYGTIDEKMFKWCPWAFPVAPICIVGDIDDTTKSPVLHYSTSVGIYDVKDNGLVKNDYSHAIDSYIRTSLKTADKGFINHFGGMKLRVKGSGVLTTTLYGEDASNPTAGTSITLSSTPGKEPHILMNYINEKMSVRLRVSSIDEYFVLTKIDIYAKALWLVRPA